MKLDTTLGFNGTTYVTYDSGIVTDSNDLLLIGAPNGSAQEVVVIGDTTSPSIISYFLDTNDGQLSLTFDEPIQLSTLMQPEAYT